MATETFCNNYQTTLNGGIDNAQVTITVTSNAGFPASAQFRIIVDSEIMTVTAGQAGLVWTVTRNSESIYQGSGAVSHATGATVTQIVTAGSLTNAIALPVAGATWGAATLLTLNSVANNYGLSINGPAGAGTSFGVFVSAGTNSSDYAARFQTDALIDILKLRGDGQVIANGPITVPSAISAAIPVTNYGTLPIKIDDQVLVAPAASITFVNPLPTGFRHLFIEWYARGDTAATSTGILVRFNNISTATYDYEVGTFRTNTPLAAETLGQTGILAGTMPANTATASYFGQGEIKVKYYNGTVGNKLVTADDSYATADTATNQNRDSYMGKWRTTATAITRIDLIPVAGNFVAGSVFTLYGIA